MKLYNTASRRIEELKPLNPPEVSVYTCGPTVYSEPLVGNWAAYIRWDLLVRTLRANGLQPKRVMNITDVGHLTSDADEGEDKMEKGARREGTTAWEIAAKYTASFLDGMDKLNLLPPEYITKATEHIDIQIDLIKQLEDKGHTYGISDGVYFDTSTFPNYAKFAGLDLASLKAGARVEMQTDKRNPSDFALWKFSPANSKRDMEWDSPWGKGFPGWHIECSAMAMSYLGQTIDIHTGGIDHIPVHHSNEIAQSEAASGQPFANIWLHSNFLLSEGRKISKSLNNGYTLDDVVSRGFDPIDLKLFILQSHYRSESNFTWDNLEAARNRLNRWRAIAERRWQIHDTLVNDDLKDNRHDVNGVVLAAPHAAREALNDDLNSPEALAHIDKAFDAIESAPLDQLQLRALQQLLTWIDETLGLRLMASTPDIDDQLKQLILARKRAREQKDWAESDRLRDELKQHGIEVKDTANFTIWHRTTTNR